MYAAVLMGTVFVGSLLQEHTNVSQGVCKDSPFVI